MKKKGLLLSILLVISMMVCPIWANAASGEIFGAKDQAMTQTTEGGQSIVIENEGENTKVYLGVNITSGTFTEYNATLKLTNSNYTFNKFARSTGWTGTVKADESDPSLIHISLKHNTGVTTGKHLVATIYLNVSDTAQSTENCTIELTREDGETTPETPKCKIENDKYYCQNGQECTEEEYEEQCPTTTENPQTGSFLPYAVIIGGVAVAAGLYMLTKKNKIYHI